MRSLESAQSLVYVINQNKHLLIEHMKEAFEKSLKSGNTFSVYIDSNGYMFVNEEAGCVNVRSIGIDSVCVASYYWGDENSCFDFDQCEDVNEMILEIVDLHDFHADIEQTVNDLEAGF